MAALVRFASERSSSGDLEPRTKVTLSGNELCDKVTGDGLSDNFVKEHPVHEAPYRVYVALRAVGWLAAREVLVLFLLGYYFFLSSRLGFRHKGIANERNIIRISIIVKVIIVNSCCSCMQACVAQSEARCALARTPVSPWTYLKLTLDIRY